ncbi:hypothetical protein BDY24DRAFT_188132 [Mrakia frigida]|uniref:uncharacterized protein n=1 Tax=Mrakia frigida TaxID=29902 RepID=UPI003FCBFFF1
MKAKQFFSGFKEIPRFLLPPSFYDSCNVQKSFRPLLKQSCLVFRTVEALLSDRRSSSICNTENTEGLYRFSCFSVSYSTQPQLPPSTTTLDLEAESKCTTTPSPFWTRPFNPTGRILLPPSTTRPTYLPPFNSSLLQTHTRAQLSPTRLSELNNGALKLQHRRRRVRSSPIIQPFPPSPLPLLPMESTTTVPTSTDLPVHSFSLLGKGLNPRPAVTSFSLSPDPLPPSLPFHRLPTPSEQIPTTLFSNFKTSSRISNRCLLVHPHGTAKR